MTEFTPISAALGGALIGLSALFLLLLLGRVAGCSGIVTSALQKTKQVEGDWAWRVCFLIGLIIGPAVVAQFSTISLPLDVNFSLPVIVVGGLLVGIGAAVGNGCTSGHGICGMGRLSKRSITATMVFMAFAFVTVFIVRHVLG